MLHQELSWVICLLKMTDLIVLPQFADLKIFMNFMEMILYVLVGISTGDMTFLNRAKNLVGTVFLVLHL
jgi:hypothetical protein